MTRSLRTRLLVSAALLQAVFLGITGLILDRAFSSSVQEAAYNSLQGQLFGLMAAIDVEGAEFRFSGILPEAQIFADKLGTVWRSSGWRRQYTLEFPFTGWKANAGNVFPAWRFQILPDAGNAL